MKKDSNDWWYQSREDVSRILAVDLRSGLPTDESQQRLRTYGSNRLAEYKQISPLGLFLDQFSSVIIWILIAAACIAGILGEVIDAVAIGTIVILNAILGFFQEYRAEKSLVALRKMAISTAKVVRDGQLQTIHAEELVPGDLILLEAGDAIPADGRIVQSIGMSVQEATLTGESVPVHKVVERLLERELPIADRKNMVFLGTSVVSGKGYTVITETGSRTELGKIAYLLQQGKEEPTPLQSRLEELGHRLVWLCLSAVAMVFVMGGLLLGQPLLDNFLLSISLAVAAIPEGLPAVVTVALSIGVRRMAARKALVRRLPSVETLGCASVICTDKTGTLTQNEMVVRSIWVNGSFVDISGTGYAPQGYFEVNQSKIDGNGIPGLMTVLTIGVCCNGAELYQQDGVWQVVGDPTEGALLTVAGKAGLLKREMEKTHPIVDEMPFESDRKLMSVARQCQEGIVLFTKGAVDAVLARSASILVDGNIEALSEGYKKSIIDANRHLASKALRVLAVAYRPLSPDEGHISEENLIFAGLIGMIDPPRPEVKNAIETCRRAGITPVMITGDHKETAVAIAREIGLIRDGERAITGSELDIMSDDQLMHDVRNIAVYARTSASHKLRIVRAWKSLGEVVAMTGDGVNDAPAIKEADIGVAMGITGTDVTKEAADMVLLDDNFASLVNAVEEGRGIYDNITKFVHYLLSSNIAELVAIFLGMLLFQKDFAGNWFVVFSAVQLLWLNLVTDGFPAIALGIDPVDPTAMSRPPRNVSESMLPLGRAVQLILAGFSIAFGALAACRVGLNQSAELAQTMAFTTMVVLELLKVQVVRSRYHMGLFTSPYMALALGSSLVLQLLVVYIPFFQTFFRTVPLGFHDWGVIGGISCVVWLINLTIGFSCHEITRAGKIS